ncbi:MAG: alpha/beta hydrolase [Planctomycetales bacterium]
METLLHVAVILGGVILGIALFVALSAVTIHLIWMVFFQFIYLPICARVFTEIPWMKAKAEPPLDPAEECEFTTEDGVTLRGSYLATPAAQRLGTVVYCHELTGDRWGAVPYLESVWREGFDVFAFDFRNHGASDSVPDYLPLPYTTEYELLDVKAAVDFVAERQNGSDSKLALMGVSRGGTTALSWAARDARIHAVVTDGAFPLVPTLNCYLRRYCRIFTFLGPIVDWLPEWWASWHMGWTVRHVQRVRTLQFVRLEWMVHQIQQPVMMVHGARDNYIPLSAAETISRKLRNLKEMWVVPKAKHNRAIYVAGDEYLPKLAAFLRENLAEQPPHIAP